MEKKYSETFKARLMTLEIDVWLYYIYVIWNVEKQTLTRCPLAYLELTVRSFGSIIFDFSEFSIFSLK